MPYGEGPKSSCMGRTAPGFDVVRPLMKSTYALEFGSTGALLMSRFHQLARGNTCLPASVPPSAGGSAACTLADKAAAAATASRGGRTGVNGRHYIIRANSQMPTTRGRMPKGEQLW